MTSLKDNRLLRRFLELGLPLEDCCLFGSAPMLARGMRESHDLDVLVRGPAWEKAKATLPWAPRPDGYERVLVPGDENGDGEIEIYPGWRPGDWDVDGVIDQADWIEGLPFARLEDVIRWKKLMGRPKDLKDIQTIVKYLKAGGQ